MLRVALGAEQDLGDQPVLERVGRSPFAGEEGVMAEMPPRIVGEVLRPAIHFPLAAHVEGLVVHQEDAAKTLALAIAEGSDVDSLGAAVDGVGSRVAGLVRNLLGLDHLGDFRTPGIGPGVGDVDAR